jgi:hypothetical protein
LNIALSAMSPWAHALSAGPEAVVGHDEPVVVGLDPRSRDVQRVGVGPAAQRDQEFVAPDGDAVAALGLGVDAYACPVGLDGRHAVVGVDLVALPGDLSEGLRDLGVLAGDQAVHHLDDRHVGPQRFEEVAEFDRDVPPAHNDQAVGLFAEVQRVGAGEVIHLIEAVDGRDHRPGAGGDDHPLAADALPADLDGALVDERRLVIIDR